MQLIWEEVLTYKVVLDRDVYHFINTSVILRKAFADVSASGIGKTGVMLQIILLHR